MVSDVPMRERMSEQSEADCRGVDERASGALQSERVSERVALLNYAVLSIINHSGMGVS